MKDMVELGDKNLFRGFGQRNLTDEGNGLMEQIRAALMAMDKEQHALLDQEQATLAEKTEQVTMVSLAGSMLAGVLVLASGACALRALQGRAKVEEKLDQLLGSLPDALIIVNAEGKIVGSNAHAEKLFGYSDRELQGESMALLVPERFRKSQRQYYATYFSRRGGQIPEMTTELCGLHKDGREFPIEVRTNQLAAEKGLVVTSAIRDITERKQVALQIAKLNRELELRAIELENANKEWEAFSYSVSHDLRSPLQNISRFSLILMEDYASQLDQAGLDYVQRLRGNCQHMEDIIDALLALSNMMRKELLVDHFDLTALANAVAADLKQKDPDRLVDWVVAEGLTAEGDAHCCESCWKICLAMHGSSRPTGRARGLNSGRCPRSMVPGLILCATTALVLTWRAPVICSRHSSACTIRASFAARASGWQPCNGSFTAIRVKSGPKVLSTREQLFASPWRIRPGNQMDKIIMSQNQGNSPGAGAPNKALRVLIADDSEDDVVILLHILCKAGYQPVYERVSTAPAMKAALEQSWDIVISDFEMPHFGGFEALQLLRESGCDLPFILVSAVVSEEMAVTAMKAGAHDYIMKRNLTRLPPAIERELQEFQTRAARKAAEEALRRSEEQLRQSQKIEAVGRLAAGVAHDFNNFLTAITGHSELLLRQLGADDPLRKHAEQIEKVAYLAAVLTRQLLSFSRKQVIEPRVLELNAVIHNIEKMLRQLIGGQYRILRGT